MQIEEYYLHYDLFHKEFAPEAGPEEKRAKLFSEMHELHTANLIHKHHGGPKQAVIDEAIDVMNTTLAYLKSEGIFDPLWHGVMKLERTAEKYRNQSSERI